MKNNLSDAAMKQSVEVVCLFRGTFYFKKEVSL